MEPPPPEKPGSFNRWPIVKPNEEPFGRYLWLF